jgi:hypothetical protein
LVERLVQGMCILGQEGVVVRCVSGMLTSSGSSVDRVWVPDVREGYVAGWVVREEGDLSVVALESGNEVSRPASRQRGGWGAHPSVRAR